MDQTTRSIIVRTSAPTVFKIWSHFEEFPRFMQRIISVTPRSRGLTHWVMEGPLGTLFEWDAHVTRFEDNKRIAWNSTPESPMRTSGQVTFTELGPGETQVTVMMRYVPPAGVIGSASDAVFGDADERLEGDLRRFKAYAEGRTVAEVTH
jgi:uncharacterized membrane protein